MLSGFKNNITTPQLFVSHIVLYLKILSLKTLPVREARWGLLWILWKIRQILIYLIPCSILFVGIGSGMKGWLYPLLLYFCFESSYQWLVSSINFHRHYRSLVLLYINRINVAFWGIFSWVLFLFAHDVFGLSLWCVWWGQNQQSMIVVSPPIIHSLYFLCSQ